MTIDWTAPAVRIGVANFAVAALALAASIWLWWSERGE
jgi:hypothetical protein